MSSIPPETEELLASCKGVVLDVGPGSGLQLHHFDASKVTKVYGVEPAQDMHEQLLRNVEKTGLSGIYEIIAAGAEPRTLIPALAKRNILKTNDDGVVGIFDCITCVCVLCGVPTPEETIQGLYRLLKPGGRLIFCEHVIQPYPNGGDFIAKVLQRFYTLIGWRFWLGGCCLDRDIDKMLRQSGGTEGWSQRKISYLNTYSTIPYIVGEYVKRS